MIHALEESISGFETVSESPLENAEWLCQISEHPLMLTLKSYPDEEEKVAHPTISPWHHQNCYWADHLGVLQRSSIQTRQFM